MYTDDIHRLVSDGLRADSTLRWGTHWDGARSGAKATVTVNNIETGEIFLVTIVRAAGECRNHERCGSLGICICEREAVAS